MKKNHIFAGALAVDIIIADQVTKWLASEHLQNPYRLFPGVSLEYAENTGIAFSLPVPQPILIPLSIVLIAGIILYAARNIKTEMPVTIPILAFIIGGAVGNMIDRIARGYVIDFIRVGWWPSFNLADTFLVIGIFLLILFYGKINRSDSL